MGGLAAETVFGEGVPAAEAAELAHGHSESLGGLAGG